MSSILTRIVDQKKEDLIRRKKQISVSGFRNFAGWEKKRYSLSDALGKDELQIIAEIKKASPSKGVIREDFDPVSIAGSYSEHGAAALSVLTEERFFQGDPEFIQQLSAQMNLPILRKDFIIDFYQLDEARGIGADAVLLIASITSGNQLMELHHAATELGLETLIECYDPEEFGMIDYDKVQTVGINNRDLNTFEVDVHRGTEALKTLPDHLITVSESGLSTPEDLEFLHSEGIDAALIGEHFMRQPDPGKALSEIRKKQVPE